MIVVYAVHAGFRARRDLFICFMLGEQPQYSRLAYILQILMIGSLSFGLSLITAVSSACAARRGKVASPKGREYNKAV